MDIFIWPAVALLLGLVAIREFKPAIVKKIAGITSATKDSVSFERSQEGAELQPAPLPFVEIMKHPMSPTALEREQFVDKQIHSLGLATDSEKIAALVRVFAITRIEFEFNNIAHTIFGSQVALLIQISGTKNGITRQEANATFEQAQKEYPDLHGGRKFEEWFSYPLNSNLVTFVADRIDITQYGKDFLKHLVDTRQAHQRYG